MPDLVNKVGTKKRKAAVCRADVDAILHMRSTNRVSKERHEHPPLKSEEDDDNEEEKRTT